MEPFLIGAALAGTALSAAGTVYEGMQAESAAEFEAKQLRMKGRDELAIAARSAEEKRREGQLAESRARAVAAASGGGTDNPTVNSILTGIANRGEYNALTELYSGQVRKDTLYGQAAATKAAGRSAFTGSLIKGAGTIFEGISSAGISYAKLPKAAAGSYGGPTNIIPRGYG